MTMREFPVLNVFFPPVLFSIPPPIPQSSFLSISFLSLFRFSLSVSLSIYILLCQPANSGSEYVWLVREEREEGTWKMGLKHTQPYHLDICFVPCHLLPRTHTGTYTLVRRCTHMHTNTCTHVSLSWHVLKHTQ